MCSALLSAQRSPCFHLSDMKFSRPGVWALIGLSPPISCEPVLQAPLLVGMLPRGCRLPVASLTAGLNSVPITEKFSVMSRESSKGNAPVTIVTSVPWERERDITVIAVIAARSAKRRSVSDSDVIVAGAAFILPLELVFACFATIGQSFGLAWANRSSGKVGGKEFP